MKKILIGLAVIALLGIAGIPYFVGKTAQDNITQSVSTSNNGTIGKIDIISYDRGWRTSKSHYKWTLPASYAENLDSIEFHCEAAHGLNSYQYECLLDQSGDYGKFVSERLNGIDPLSLTGTVDMAGNSHNNLTLNPFTTDKDGEVIAVEKANILIDSDADFTHINTTGSFDGATLDLATSNVSIGKVEFDGDIEMFKESIALGDTSASIHSLEIKDPEMSVILDTLSMKTETTQDDGQIASITKLSIDKLDVDAAGDQHAFDSITSTVDISDLNAGAFIALNDVLNTLQDKSEENAQAYGEAYTQLSESIEAVLLPGLALEYEVEGNYNEGKVSLEIDTEVVSTLSLEDATMMLLNFEGLLDKFTISIKSDIPTSVTGVDPLIASTIERSGLFTQTDEGYAVDLQLKKDSSTLNGEETSVTDLMGLFM